MPMTWAEQYFYFVIVISMWTWPIMAIALFLGYRRRRLPATVVGIVVMVLGTALVRQQWVHFEAGQRATHYDDRQREFSAFLAGHDRSAFIAGKYVGSETRHTAQYRRYQFPAPATARAKYLMILVPEDRGNALGLVVLSDIDRPAIAPARLAMRDAAFKTNPSVATDVYFSEEHAGSDPYVLGAHTLLLALVPDRSVIVTPAIDQVQPPWLWVSTQVELD
ncbi:MAG: hypothetical protein AAF270_08225 [Pseudomonadota bacterium]